MDELRNIIVVHNPQQRQSDAELVEFSVPFSQGACFVARNWMIVCEAGNPLPCHFEVLSFWPNNSIRWVKVTAYVTLTGKAQETLSLCYDSKAKPNTSKLIQANSEQIIIPTATGPIRFDRQNITSPDWTISQFNHFNSVSSVEIKTSLNWDVKFDHSFASEHPLVAVIERLTTVQIAGYPEPLNISERFTIEPLTGSISATLILHNTNRALHENGQWDLGDPNSIFITSAGYEVIFHNESLPTQNIIQLNSGGQQWSSRAHVNHLNEVNVGAERCPQRHSPWFTLDHRHWTINDFWQKFPSQLNSAGNLLSLSMAVPELSDYQELQPGEKWSRTFVFNAPHKAKPCVVQVKPEYIALTQAVDKFDTHLSNHPIWPLLLHSDAPNNWMQKREAIDLYGFRHFGELFADHESAQLMQGEDYLISVYNNQYDPLAGFLRMWCLTGDIYWWELGRDLAQHILDIDIYHTEADKPEYSGGLFWHTDHYVDAATSSHRTYSKRQAKNVYMDHAGGGGPGGQHCYTEGLTLYYWLTGCNRAKEAVGTLHQWITHVYEGDNTLLSFVLGLKNRTRPDLKNILTGRYPFDRGTANYINTCIDQYNITSSKQYLVQAWHIITHTCSHSDDITLRDFSNIESTWFYTVMLQAIARFDRSLPEVLQMRMRPYTRGVLLHYTRWMVKHETPYLTQPEKLEYPNQTWSAQDLRKVDILRYTASFCENLQSKKLLQKANEIEEYVVQSLQNSDESNFTRIQALMMQNMTGIKTYQPMQDEKLDNSNVAPAPILTEKKLDFLAPWSIKMEITQLKKRSPALGQWIP